MLMVYVIDYRILKREHILRSFTCLKKVDPGFLSRTIVTLNVSTVDSSFSIVDSGDMTVSIGAAFQEVHLPLDSRRTVRDFITLHTADIRFYWSCFSLVENVDRYSSVDDYTFSNKFVEEVNVSNSTVDDSGR